MFLLARDLFILMGSAIIWIYFRNSQLSIFLTAVTSLLRDLLAITLNKFTETELEYFIKYLLRAILLPRKHLLVLLSQVVLVVEVLVVVMVVIVIVEAAVVVVVKSWPELVNNKLEAKDSKYKFGARAANHKFETRTGKHKFGARAVKYKLGARAT